MKGGICEKGCDGQRSRWVRSEHTRQKGLYQHIFTVVPLLVSVNSVWLDFCRVLAMECRVIVTDYDDLLL